MSDNEGKPEDTRGPSVPPGTADAAARASAPPPAEAAGDEAAKNGETQAGSETDKLRAELEKAQADAAKYRDQLLRTAADFDNYRKRARRDVEDAQRKGLERALLEVLPVSDNLERAVQAAAGTTDVGSILEGVRMVLKFFEDALSRLGVERVPSVGHPFDPGLHEAVQQVESDDAPGTVVSELAPGYRVDTKLLRAAMVAVARPRAAAKAPEPTDGGGSDGAQQAPQN